MLLIRIIYASCGIKARGCLSRGRDSQLRLLGRYYLSKRLLIVMYQVDLLYNNYPGVRLIQGRLNSLIKFKASVSLYANS